MVEPLKPCASNALQRFIPIGISYLGNRKVYLLGGAAILICALLIIIAPSFLYSSEKHGEKSKNIASQIEKPQKKFKSRITNGKLFSEQTLLNETLILKFLTHPKARNLILEGRKKSQKYALDVYPEVQRFGESYPDYPEVQTYVKEFAIYAHPFPYEEVFVPFLSLGALDTSSINDPDQSYSDLSSEDFQILAWTL